MYHFTFITIGANKPGPHKELSDEYLKRLSSFATIEQVVLKAEPFQSENNRTRVLATEADRVRKALPKDTFSILLTEHGKTYDTPQFSTWIEKVAEHGARHIAFVIGGPLGVDESLVKELDANLSLSPLTFPHDLARVVLLEQLYRAMTIQKGKTYHY